MKERQKKQIIALVGLSIFFSAGCTTSNTIPQPIATNINFETPALTPRATIDTTIHTDNLMGIYAGKKRSQIGLGLSKADIEETLGKPSEKVKKKKHIQWYYKELDITISLQKQEDTYRVSKIKGGSEAITLKTGGDITVGSKKQDVLNAYKNMIFDKDAKKKLEIENGYSRLVFYFDDGIVNSIVLELME